MIPLEQLEVVDDFASFGIHAFTTTRQVGSFSSSSDEPIREVMGRWDALRATIVTHGVSRLATARQVHGAEIIVHVPGWTGWLRGAEADGHVSVARGTAVAVSAADCVPVCIAHPSGAVALLHSGWRGTVARIVVHAIDVLEQRGCLARDLHVHLGPAICGDCYEVSADVAQRLLGSPVHGSRRVDLRSIVAGHARERGVRFVSASPLCTRCDRDRFYSHRGGDAGRQLSVMFAEPR